MKKSELTAMFLLLMIFVFLRVLLTQRGSIDELYIGPGFQNNDIFIFIYYVLFAIYTLVLFGKTSKYVSNYGLIILIHTKSIWKIVMTVVSTTLFFVIISEVMKIAIYIIFSFIKYKTIQIYDVKQTIIMAIMTILVFSALLLWQMLWEFFIDQREALIMTNALYISLYFFSKIMYLWNPHSLINRWNPINYLFSNRIYKLTPNLEHNFYIPLIGFLLLLIVFIALAIPFIRKKDWL